MFFWKHLKIIPSEKYVVRWECVRVEARKRDLERQRSQLQVFFFKIIWSCTICVFFEIIWCVWYVYFFEIIWPCMVWFIKISEPLPNSATGRTAKELSTDKGGWVASHLVCEYFTDDNLSTVDLLRLSSTDKVECRFCES